ncbi:hypothetical protein J2802_001802 [Paraburkholderia caribensis]|nr:hypothetical protein [Paraburkholderia caribensis]
MNDDVRLARMRIGIDACPRCTDGRRDKAAGTTDAALFAATEATSQARMTLSLDVSASVVDRLLNRRDLLGFFIRNFHAEFVFESHHQLDRVERVSAEVVHERCFVLDFRFGNTELFCNDLLDALFDIVHYPSKGKKFINTGARILSGLHL